MTIKKRQWEILLTADDLFCGPLIYTWDDELVCLLFIQRRAIVVYNQLAHSSYVQESLPLPPSTRPTHCDCRCCWTFSRQRICLSPQCDWKNKRYDWLGGGHDIFEVLQVDMTVNIFGNTCHGLICQLLHKWMKFYWKRMASCNGLKFPPLMDESKLGLPNLQSIQVYNCLKSS